MNPWNRSEELLQRAKKVIPGGINSNVRSNTDSTKLFFTHASGSRIWDADGNEYIDYLLGQGPLLLGHSHPRVLAAITEALAEGQLYAGQNEREVLLAETMVRLIPSAESVRIGLTGSEMVHAALRLARAFTGRSKIIKFEGHYHGWFDNILTAVSPSTDQPRADGNTPPVPSTAGQPASALEDLIILPWNDLPLIEATFRTHGAQIAAVITEPMMCNTGAIAPRPGYLAGLQRVCRDHGSLLIFDEVITGFRLSLGGAQQAFGVTPDLSIFGKALANGMPVAALVGRADVMRLFGTHEVNHSGTFNAYVPGIAAALATLAELEADDGAVYQRIAGRGQQLMDGLTELTHRLDVPLAIQGLPCAFHLAVGGNGTLTEYRDYQKSDRAITARLSDALLAEGVRTAGRGIWYVSGAHDADDLEITLDAAERAMRQVWR